MRLMELIQDFGVMSQSALKNNERLDRRRRAVRYSSTSIGLLVFYFLSLGPVLWISDNFLSRVPLWVLDLYGPAAALAEKWSIYANYLEVWRR